LVVPITAIVLSQVQNSHETAQEFCFTREYPLYSITNHMSLSTILPNSA